MKLQTIQDKITIIRGRQVILDSDVAELYGVETKHVNQAVRNNPEKFPTGYILILDEDEWNILRSKKLTAKYSKTRVAPKGFSEKSLYMLATIIKSPVATETTLAIIETFAKVKELSCTIAEMSEQTDKKQQNLMMQRSEELIANILNNDFQTTATETTIELNLSVLKVKHTVKRKPKSRL